MIVKRNISILLLIALIITSISFLGCHGHRPLTPFEIPEEFDSSKTYEITFWAKNEDNAVQRDVYAKAISDFEKLYPNIKVTLRNETDYETIYKDVLNNILTNTTPNVCITYPDHVATYMEGENMVVSLDSLMSHPKYGLGGSALKFDSPTAQEIIPEFLNEGKIGGIQYALPFMRSTEACYVNKTLLESLGFELPEILTWDFVWEVSEYAMSLGKDTNGNFVANGKKVFFPLMYKSDDNMIISMMKQLGIPYSNDQGDILFFNNDTKELLKEICEHAKNKYLSFHRIDGYPANKLNAGECIFAIDSTAGSTWMGSKSPLNSSSSTYIDFDMKVMAIPQYNPNNPQMISQGPSLCIFNKEDNGEVLASWIFAQFLLTNEVQIAYSQTEGYIPVTSKAHNSEEYQRYLNHIEDNDHLYYFGKIEATKLLLNNLQNTFTTPVFNGSSDLRKTAGTVIFELVKASQRKINVDDEYILDYFEKIKHLEKLDQFDGVEGFQKKELGNLPMESTVLLTILALAWSGLSLYFVLSRIKRKKHIDISAK